MSKQLENFPEEKFNDYDRVESNNFMVTGKVEENIEFYNNKSGERTNSPEKKDPEDIREQKIEIPHSILHYIDKDDPLGGEPRVKDPMYERWENAVNSNSML